MSFHPGQRVVCVDDSPTLGRWKKTWFGFSRRWVTAGSDLAKGRVYTIAGVFMGVNQADGSQELAVQLVELPPFSHQPTGAYEARRFRPLSEQRLDQFRAHLAPVDVRKVAA